MKFDAKIGCFNLNDKFILFPEIKKNKIMQGDIHWEEWFSVSKQEVIQYRAVIQLGSGYNHEEFIISHFNKPNIDDATLTFWQFSPANAFMGRQNRPDGKIIKN